MTTVARAMVESGIVENEDHARTWIAQGAVQADGGCGQAVIADPDADAAALGDRVVFRIGRLAASWFGESR